MYIYIHVHIYMYIHKHIHIYICIYIRVYMYIRINSALGAADSPPKTATAFTPVMNTATLRLFEPDSLIAVLWHFSEFGSFDCL